MSKVRQIIDRARKRTAAPKPAPSKRAIRLGDGRWVTLRSYLRVIKEAKANPTMVFDRGLTGWWSCTGEEIMRQFRQGMMDRINQAIPYIERGVSRET